MGYRRLAAETSAHMARSNDLMGDIRTEVRLTREVVRSNEIAFRDLRESNRAMVEVISELAGLIRELRADSRAHTNAILALIDRLENGGAEPAT